MTEQGGYTKVTFRTKAALIERLRRLAEKRGLVRLSGRPNVSALLNQIIEEYLDRERG